MTTAFAALLIGVVGVGLLLALFAYYWVNRTPSTDERFDEYGRVPLFGVDLVATPAKGITPIVEHEEVEVSSNIEPKRDPAHEFSRAVEPNSVSAPLSGQPVAIDTSAVDVASDALRVERVDPAPAHRIHDHRFGGKGWGASPGWPVPEVQTPRYVPPIASEASRPAQQPSPAPVAPPASNGNGVYADGIPGSMVEGHRLRFSTPAEGTLQFLPGRLEISSGLDSGREIRFVRVPGPNGTEVTFGRNEGPLYRHIQLRDQTVSREHARLTLIDGHWLLTNLSKTNPVAHNGRVLGIGEHQLLDDGDRLDMGEVIFSFRSR